MFVAIAAWQSQWIEIEVKGWELMGRFAKKFLSHSASVHAFSKAISSDSMVEWVIHVCLEDFYETAPPPRVNIYPLVDFVSLDLRI